MFNFGMAEDRLRLCMRTVIHAYLSNIKIGFETGIGSLVLNSKTLDLMEMSDCSQAYSRVMYSLNSTVNVVKFIHM